MSKQPLISVKCLTSKGHCPFIVTIGMLQIKYSGFKTFLSNETSLSISIVDFIERMKSLKKDQSIDCMDAKWIAK